MFRGEYGGKCVLEEKDNAREDLVEYASAYAGLLPLLRDLDERLAAAIRSAEQIFAARAAGDLYRGLAITPADVAAALGRLPGQPFLSLSAPLPVISEQTDSLPLRRLLWLAQKYGLSDLDLGAMLIGLAPEIDLRYERLYAYLHDDVTRRRPSIDLALNVLCHTLDDRFAARARFAAGAPLVRHGIVQLVADGPGASWLARWMKPDDRVVEWLHGSNDLEPR